MMKMMRLKILGARLSGGTRVSFFAKASRRRKSFCAASNRFYRVMQKPSFTKGHQQGSTLIVTLFILSLMSIFLYSYLYIAREQRSNVARSQGWNAALGLAE